MVLISTERGDQRKRSLLLVGVFAFLFHAIVPYFYWASAEPADGYITTVCTAYGYKTVFVAFDATEQSSDSAIGQLDSYYECPTCIVHAHASGWIEPYATLFNTRLPQVKRERDRPYSMTPESQYYPSFLIRGPPA
ncbi:MAG: hypothetical protein HN842_05655 [Gammaproteobacteria bacterium]|jgi:hypothetical protein|nr:hypothetical protein [Gammaproteobacteria bacterium]MBT7307682.1 hypothetical protein [Gammaproteobacteria bacterium]